LAFFSAFISVVEKLHCLLIRQKNTFSLRKLKRRKESVELLNEILKVTKDSQMKEMAKLLLLKDLVEETSHFEN